MKILQKMQAIADIGKSTKEMQSEINVSEVWHMWDMLNARYNILELTHIFHNFADSPDFKLVLTQGINLLNKQVKELEQLMIEYGVPMPPKPPEKSNHTSEVEVITDRFIFTQIYVGIQTFIPIHANAFIASTSPKVRETYKKLLIDQVDIYDKFYEYGNLNNWINPTPKYRP
ncbi:MAG: hypothetical protein JM58_18160 [Peptococcaceae bacterium BICA1-8]|nr:MAG: hypothetical protein JM58_18160 [Peptococcaceae bacterium BICA1-8]